MTDYLSRKNEIPLYGGFNIYRRYKFEKPIYPSSVYMRYLLTKDESILKESYDNAIPEFRRFNIVEAEIENIA